MRFALADAALLEKDRPRGVELDPQRDQPHRNCKNDRGCQRKDNVQQALAVTLVHKSALLGGMLCPPELLRNLLPGEKRSVAGGGHNGVVGAHAAVGVVGRDHLLQNVDDLVAVVPGRVLEPLQVGVEFFQIDLHGRRDEDFVVGGFGHLVLL